MTTGDTLAIKVHGLIKRFGEVQALAGVDFEVHRGELFGLLGPNGAGKTTTINILTGLARPDGGTVRIAGIDCSRRPQAAQRLMGVVPDESNLYPELTGLENLSFCGALYGMTKRAREAQARKLLAHFELADVADRKFASYSRGMKRKLTLAAGLMHGPTLLFLDEPTTGIDVASARRIRRLLAEYHRGGMTIFLTTHYIEEAERLCDRIAFIVAGRIVRIDTVENLMRGTAERYVIQFTISGGATKLAKALSAAFTRLTCLAVAVDTLRVESSEPVRVGELVRFLEDHGAEVAEARKVRPALEDVFVRITGIAAAAMRQENDKRQGVA